METSHCRVCDCKEFSPQLWKDSKCKECFHYLLDHSKDFQRHSVEKEESSTAHEFASEQTTEAPFEKRFHIVKEILTTERAYVECLSAMTDIYLAALKGIPDNVLSQSQMLPIFSNIEEILPVNKQLLKELEERWENWSPNQCIGDVLLAITPFLKTYTSYTAGYSLGLQALKECEKNNVFQGVITKCSVHYKLGLSSLMIQPVQRIPRYNLLLADLLKSTDENHPDYNNITLAYKRMLHVADNINEAIRISENRRKVLEIQNSIIHTTTISLVAPHRMFVRQGVLTKICRKANKKFTFFLFSDLLIYANPLPGEKRYLLNRKIGLENCRIEEQGAPNVPFSFVIANSQKSFAVFTETQALKDEWVSDITQQIRQMMTRKESFKGSLDSTGDSSEGTEAPVWAPDDSTLNCSICKDEFGFFTRRHHCRACGQVVCSKCSDKKLRIVSLDPKNDVRVCTACYTKRKTLRQSQDASQTQAQTQAQEIPEVSKSPRISPRHSQSPRSSSSSEVMAFLR